MRKTTPESFRHDADVLGRGNPAFHIRYNVVNQTTVELRMRKVLLRDEHLS